MRFYIIVTLLFSTLNFKVQAGPSKPWTKPGWKGNHPNNKKNSGNTCARLRRSFEKSYHKCNDNDGTETKDRCSACNAAKRDFLAANYKGCTLSTNLYTDVKDTEKSLGCNSSGADAETPTDMEGESETKHNIHRPL